MKAIFIMPLPPPVHGSSMMSMYIKESKLINDNIKCDYVNLSTSRNMNEIQKFSTAKIFRFLSSYIKALYLLLTNRYDICYLATSCFGIPFLKDAPFVLMCKLLGKKVFIHFHNKGMKQYADKVFYRFMYKQIYKNTKIILLSELLYDDVKSIIEKKQVFICPNGIPEIKNEVVKKANDVPNILFLSNLIESKGVLVLINACKKLKEQGIEFVCNIVGGETKEIDSERINNEIRERGLVNFVYYRGKAYGEDKEHYFNNTDIFVFPTFYAQECFPVVLLEAMQHGLPCISSFEGAIPKIIKDGYNGLICNPHDIYKLSKCLEKLIKDKNLREDMGKNGLNMYNEKYTLKHYENRIYNIINN